MPSPTTLLSLAGADTSPARLQNAALLLIDIQNEYRDGPVAVKGADTAISHAQQLLSGARQHHAPVFHVAHRGKAGGLFDRDVPRGEIVPAVAPTADEIIVEKQLPNAFAGTDLDSLIRNTGRTELVICGFMTHMCVSSTARAALDRGYRTTVVAPACATRDLPDRYGGALSAEIVHTVAIAALADRFAAIAYSIEELV